MDDSLRGSRCRAPPCSPPAPKLSPSASELRTEDVPPTPKPPTTDPSLGDGCRNGWPWPCAVPGGCCDGCNGPYALRLGHSGWLLPPAVMWLPAALGVGGLSMRPPESLGPSRAAMVIGVAGMLPPPIRSWSRRYAFSCKPQTASCEDGGCYATAAAWPEPHTCDLPSGLWHLALRILVFIPASEAPFRPPTTRPA